MPVRDERTGEGAGKVPLRDERTNEGALPRRDDGLSFGAAAESLGEGRGGRDRHAQHEGDGGRDDDRDPCHVM